MFDVFTCAMFANLSANICNEIWERNCIIGVWLPFEEIYGTNLHNLWNVEEYRSRAFRLEKNIFKFNEGSVK